jgi:hypothetical protein
MAIVELHREWDRPSAALIISAKQVSDNKRGGGAF